MIAARRATPSAATAAAGGGRRLGFVHRHLLARLLARFLLLGRRLLVGRRLVVAIVCGCIHLKVKDVDDGDDAAHEALLEAGARGEQPRERLEDPEVGAPRQPRRDGAQRHHRLLSDVRLVRILADDEGAEQGEQVVRERRDLEGAAVDACAEPCERALAARHLHVVML